MPPEEADNVVPLFREHGLDPIFLLSPTSDEQRIKRIAAVASGFVYYVSLKGVTGAANLMVDQVAAKLDEIRAHTHLPLGVGFGIKDASTAAAVAKVADAVVVGSALVNRIEALADQPETISSEAKALIRGMRAAMDAN
jgi:tryptophan synthase alpha chain